METIYIQTKKKLEEIYEKFKEDSEDKTGWSLIQSLKKEADSKEGLIQYFIYSLFEIAYLKKEIINIFNLIAEFIAFPYHGEKINQKAQNRVTVNDREIFPGVTASEGILTKVLESLELKETQRAFYYYLISKEEEINEKFYLGKKAISEFEKENISMAKILDIFREEYKQKGLDKKQRLIKIGKIT